MYISLNRKSVSLRKTKTDVDTHTIASIIMFDVSLKPYSDTVYHNEDLKSLSQYKFDNVYDNVKLKQSVSRLVNILFPEL
ncbi:MAG: IS110 family transposase [Clostridiales bacterium]|nr:IS110 family transposase [Clostridiales bacterium]